MSIAPILQVESLSDGNVQYFMKAEKILYRALDKREKEEFCLTREHVTTHYHDRYGVNVGHVFILVYAAPMTGRK